MSVFMYKSEERCVHIFFYSGSLVKICHCTNKLGYICVVYVLFVVPVSH